MKRVLQAVGLILGLAAGLVWLGAGANRGWTKTSVPVKSVDEVTGIEGITYQRRLVPGLDFLGGALLGAGVTAGASLMVRNTSNPKQTKSETA